MYLIRLNDIPIEAITSAFICGSNNVPKKYESIKLYTKPTKIYFIPLSNIFKYFSLEGIL